MAISKVKSIEKLKSEKIIGPRRRKLTQAEQDKMLKDLEKLIEKDKSDDDIKPKKRSGGRHLTIVERIEKTCRQLSDTLVKKNADYGNSALTNSPLVDIPTEKALAVRMGDKIKRLRQLLKGDAPKVKESLDDTLKDIAGYAVLWLVARGKR